MHGARRVSLFRDLAEIAISHSGGWRGELRVVKGIERLDAKFEPRAFPQWREAKLLEKGQSARPGAWRPHIGQDFGRCAKGVRSGSDRHLRISEVLVEIEPGRSFQWRASRSGRGGANVGMPVPPLRNRMIG